MKLTYQFTNKEVTPWSGMVFWNNFWIRCPFLRKFLRVIFCPSLEQRLHTLCLFRGVCLQRLVRCDKVYSYRIDPFRSGFGSDFRMGTNTCTRCLQTLFQQIYSDRQFARSRLFFSLDSDHDCQNRVI